MTGPGAQLPAPPLVTGPYATARHQASCAYLEATAAAQRQFDQEVNNARELYSLFENRAWMQYQAACAEIDRAYPPEVRNRPYAAPAPGTRPPYGPVSNPLPQFLPAPGTTSVPPASREDDDAWLSH